MQGKKRILICPLDWGLGHATRCIPIIRELERQGAEIYIGANNRPLELLKKEFPHLRFILMSGYDISYSKTGNMTLTMIQMLPKIIWNIWIEHRILKKMIRQYNFDLIISDNRYGLWSSQTRCVFITHQIMIKCPPQLTFLEPILSYINRFFIQKYNECWIPDMKGEENLSGDLAHKYSLSISTYYIGPLSRFYPNIDKKSFSPEYDLLVILSGPEPQRTFLERKIISQLFKSTYRTLIVKGLPEERRQESQENLTLVSHLDSQRMKAAILNSKLIISRSGYSTVMDMVALNKPAIFIPTPGQTEQEYLAGRLKNKKWFYSESQKKIDLLQAVKKTKDYKCPNIEFSYSLLSDRILSVVN